MQSCSSSGSSNNDDGNVELANQDEAEKKKLLQEIQELRNIIKQSEWNLQVSRFKDVEAHMAKKPVVSLEIPSHSSKMPNVDVDLRNDLYRLAGFQCVKYRRDEIVLNLSSTKSIEQKDNIYAIQIFIKNNKCYLGKWVMPMSIDMNDLLSKTPVENFANITAFVMNCKRHIDCYTMRQEQFLSLQEHISNIKYCTVQSDIGFKQINLELYGVCDTENDIYMNLIIYLLYQSDKTRPFKIDVDTINKSTLRNDTKQKLKTWLREFKISDLRSAFDKVLTEDDSIFTWSQVNDSDSPLELNDTSNSDEEGFLANLQSDRKKSLRKRKKKRELRKKWNERKRQRATVAIETSEDDQNDHSKVKVPRTESPKQIPVRKKKAKTTTFISKQKKINNLVKEMTPVQNPKVKLKQTKLNFQTREVMNSNTDGMSSLESKQCNKFDSKSTNLFTSTPLRSRVNIRRLKLSSPSLESNNITSIATAKKTKNKLDNSKNSDQKKEKNDRLSKNPIRSSPRKTNRCVTRNMAKK